MGLVVVVLLVAVGIGLLRGGGLEHLGGLPLRSRRLVAAALVVQLAGGLVGGVTGDSVYVVALAVSALLVAAFLARNRGLPGSALVALGLLANVLVVGANGAMPVSLAAAARAGVPVAELGLADDARHEPVTPATRLRLLGDVVPVPLPLRPEVVSPGDVLVAAGLGQLVVLAMAGTRRRGGTRGLAPDLSPR